MATRLIGLKKGLMANKTAPMPLNVIELSHWEPRLKLSFFQLGAVEMHFCIVVHLYLNNRKQLRCVHTSLVCEDSAPQKVSVCIVAYSRLHGIPCKAHCSTEIAHLVLKDAQSCLQISTSSLLGGEVKQTKWPLFNTFYGLTLTSTV